MSQSTALPTSGVLVEPAATEVAPSNRWLILALVSISQLMVVLDATIVNIALPSAQAALGFSNDQRQWIITGYALAFGSLLLLGGRLGDMLGRKFIFLIGLSGFALASVIGGAAPNVEVLIFARVLQGVFGALLAPAALSIVTTTFTDPQERGRAFAVFGAIAGAGAGVGLLLGGILTEYLNWRWTLYVNLIFATIAIVGVVLTMRNVRPSHRIPLDLIGTALVSLGLFGIVYGFSSAETRDWTSPITIVSLVLGASLVAAFAWWQTRATSPLLPLRIILDRNRGGSMLALLISGAGMFGVFLFLTYYLQTSMSFSPIRTGLAFLPMVAAIMTSATVSSIVLVYRIGARPLIPTGMVLASLGLIYLTRLDLNSTYAADILPALLAIGAGMGLIFATGTSIGTLGVDPDDAGAGSASLNTVQQVGGSIGTALLSTLAAAAASDFLANREQTTETMAQAAIESYSTAYWWSAGLFLVGALLTVLILRSGRPQPPAEGSQSAHMA